MMDNAFGIRVIKDNLKRLNTVKKLSDIAGEFLLLRCSELLYNVRGIQAKYVCLSLSSTSIKPYKILFRTERIVERFEMIERSGKNDRLKEWLHLRLQKNANKLKASYELVLRFQGEITSCSIDEIEDVLYDLVDFLVTGVVAVKQVSQFYKTFANELQNGDRCFFADSNLDSLMF
ncbi:MAG: hypothetical protein FJ333_07560 [Sphingomonadales bacterium]|nr:hypothetical protein [Sphingomonadales bacterium]